MDEGEALIARPETVQDTIPQEKNPWGLHLAPL
jgi:hypothetical protein